MSASAPSRVVLIPGFFAFDALGDIRYFAGVEESLGRAYEARGAPLEVHYVPTPPTASIRQRAARVVDVVDRLAREGEGPIHLVGHSTGGLDARLAVAPTADLPTSESSQQAYQEVDTLLTLSTPHGGTPLASFFASAAGKPLLGVLTAMAAVILERGELPLRVATRLVELVSKLDDLIGGRSNLLDEIYEGLLEELTPERRERVVALLRDIEEDTSLVFQLTPEGVDVLDAATGDPEGIRTASVVTQAPQPALGAFRAQGPDVVGQTLTAVFALLATLSARLQPAGHSATKRSDMLDAFRGDTPASGDSDGIVPTRSQPWGRILALVDADHLDVVGHYGDEGTADWLPSGSGFDRQAFDALWARVADFQRSG